MSQKIRKVRSNTESDRKSYIISGNLYEVPTQVEIVEDDHDFIDDDDDVVVEDAKVIVGNDPCTLEDYNKANKLCENMYGVNLLETLTKLLLNNDLDIKEFSIQSLAYKVQALTRGSSGVRYHKTWGMFWAATRNIVRARGIVGFRDHFSVPSSSQLAKYQKQIVEVCGLKSDTVGRPGIQSKTAELWINSKKLQAGSEAPCLSVSMDAKKINVTESGLEDLAGLGSSQTNEEEVQVFEKEMNNLEALIKHGEREGLYTVFDFITSTSQQLINRIIALEELLAKNNKLLEKNPLLSKYIYVLNNQLASGWKIIRDAKEIQSQLISVIAKKRNCGFLCSSNGTVNLGTQKNFLQLSELSDSEEDANFEIIRQSLSDGILGIHWINLITKLTRDPNQYSRRSKTFSHLVNACYLSSETIHGSVGLGKSTPVLDMKNAWARAHSVFNISNIPIPGASIPDITATFCSSVAIMFFGKNCMIHESGIYIKNGICATPDLVVINNNGNIDYTVRFMKSSGNIFQVTEEDVVACMADSYIVGAEKGAIAVLYKDGICVVVHIPPEREVVKRMLTLADTYIKSPKCIIKRSPAMLKEIKGIQEKLLEKIGNLTIFGCFPVVENVSNKNIDEGSMSEIDISGIALKSFMHEVRGYLSKKAKELVALNISDLSGNPSKTPHTILGATYLTSSSLKLVGRQCLDEVCSMLTRNGAKVLNIGVDGESLYLASVLPDGSPGTLQSLIKHVNEKLKAVKKERLVELVSLNLEIELDNEVAANDEDEDDENIEDFESLAVDEDEIADDVLNSVSLLENEVNELNRYTIEDVEEMLITNTVNVGDDSVNRRKQLVKSLSLSHLRFMCLKYLIPKARQVWLSSSIGMDRFQIHFKDGEIMNYIPNTVFQVIDGQYFRTITFDYAHIINLFREHAAKGKLNKMGLTNTSLEHLSQQPGYEYLKRIIATKGNKLVYDSMNQKAAATLFSNKTVEGLEASGDKKGAKCVKVISEGLRALDESGMNVKTRIKRIVALKMYLEQRNEMCKRFKRADHQNMSNELLQMVLTTLDSYIYTSMNLQFFNVRRKGTGTVEQLFGQMMMMVEGCGKLDVRQLQDILKRLTLTNALRLVPSAARGFKFLSQLKQHMKSYTPDDYEDPEEVSDIDYPRFKKVDANIFPSDSLFDKPRKKEKRKTQYLRENQELDDSTMGNVRKYHKKFP